MLMLQLWCVVGLLVAPVGQEPAGAGKTVALMRLAGDVDWQLRTQVEAELEAAGFTVRGIAMEREGATVKARCRRNGVGCLAKIAAMLGRGRPSPGDYLIHGTVAPVGSGLATRLVIDDLVAKGPVREIEAYLHPGDLVGPIALARATVATIVAREHPPAPISDAERKVLAELDRGPPVTYEEPVCQLPGRAPGR